MNAKEFEQIKSYSHLLVALMHSHVQDDVLYPRLKGILKVAEEMEMFVYQIEQARKERDANVFKLRRIA